MSSARAIRVVHGVTAEDALAREWRATSPARTCRVGVLVVRDSTCPGLDSRRSGTITRATQSPNRMTCGHPPALCVLRTPPFLCGLGNRNCVGINDEARRLREQASTRVQRATVFGRVILIFSSVASPARPPVEKGAYSLVNRQVTCRIREILASAIRDVTGVVRPTNSMNKRIWFGVEMVCGVPDALMRALERCHPIAKTARVAAAVAAATSSTGSDFNCATASPTTVTNAGLFCSPRCGTGARKGASVSTSSRSRGHTSRASRTFDAFLNVMIPLNER